MQVVILCSKLSKQDLFKYGGGLIIKLINTYDVVIYDEISSDFSNVAELFNDKEKLVLLDPFCVERGCVTFTKYLSEFNNIKYLLSQYSSYTGLDLSSLKEKGIRYRNNGGANAKSVAQYAVTCMFNLLGRFPELAKSKVEPDGSVLGEEFGGKLIGIIGMGNVGVELFNIMKSLGLKVSYYNRSPKVIDAMSVSLEQVFDNDIVFVTIATNRDTRILLKNITQLIKEHNYLIDVSHYDDLYDKSAVLQLLEEGKLRGYALESESVMESSKNFISTPHVAWCTQDAEKRTIENYLSRAIQILEGKQDEVDFLV